MKITNVKENKDKSFMLTLTFTENERKILTEIAQSESLRHLSKFIGSNINRLIEGHIMLKIT